MAYLLLNWLSIVQSMNQMKEVETKVV